MRSDEPDLTARARIREAALALFAEEGFERATVRGIARRAEVSPALVLHHFGSKEELRAHCDRHITRQLFGRTEDEAPLAFALDTVTHWLDDLERLRPCLDYAARMLSEDTPAARELFSAFHDATTKALDEQIAAGVMRDVPDRTVLSAYLTLFGLAPLLLQHHLAPTLGERALTPELYRRSALPLLDLYTHGLYTDDAVLRAAHDRFTSTPPTADPQEDSDEHA